MTHKIELRGYKATLPGGRTDGLNLGTVNSYGVEQLQVVADGRWDGLAITATFHPPGGKEPVRVLVGPDGAVDVPPEATASASDTAPGKIVFAGVSEGVQRISCDLAYTVTTHAAVEGQESSATPDILQQAIAQTTAARDEAIAASTGVKESAEAAAASAAEAAKSEAVSLDAATRAERAAASAEADVSSIIDTRDEAIAAVGAAKTEALESVATAKASAVAGVETAASASVDSVNQAGQTAVDSIAKSKTDALSAVSTAQTNAVEAVNNSKSSAVNAVQAAQSAAESAVLETQGTSVKAVKTAQTSAEQAISTGKTDALEEISNAENYAVAAVVVQGNAQEERLQQIFPQPTEADEGKVPIVQDGKWILGETSNSYSKAESDARYAPISAAICTTANGNPAVCKNSLAWAFQGLRVYGNTTQDGTPSPETPIPVVSAGDSGFVLISIADHADHYQQITVETNLGLMGFKVDSDGNFTDSMGQQWICDTVDFSSGKITRNINKIYLQDITFERKSDGSYNYILSDEISASSVNAVRTKGACTSIEYRRYASGNCIYVDGKFIVITKLAGTQFETADDLKEMFARTNAILCYPLATPITLNIPKKTLSAYSALKTYDGTTFVSTTEPVAGIEADYLVNGKKYASALESRLSALEAVQAKFLAVDT